MSEHRPVDPNNESASETTNIALPAVHKGSEPSVIYTLSEDEKTQSRRFQQVLRC